MDSNADEVLPVVPVETIAIEETAATVATAAATQEEEEGQMELENVADFVDDDTKMISEARDPSTTTTTIDVPDITMTMEATNNAETTVVTAEQGSKRNDEDTVAVLAASDVEDVVGGEETIDIVVEEEEGVTAGGEVADTATTTEEEIEEESESNAISMASTALLMDLERRYMDMSTEYNKMKLELQQQHVRERTTGSNTNVTTGTTTNRGDNEQLPPQIGGVIQELQKQITVQQDTNRMIQEQANHLQAGNDTLRDEISRLTTRNNELNTKVTEMEIQVSLKDSDIIPLHHEKLRLQKEVDQISSHTTWLEQELIMKQKEYQHLRQESYDHTVQLQLQYDQTNNELIAVQTKFKEQSKLEYKLQQQLQQMMNDNIQLKLSVQQIEQTSQDEIRQQQLLITKQNEHIQQWQDRYNDIVRQNDALQNTANDAMSASQNEIKTLQERMEEKYTAIVQEQAMLHESQLKDLQRRYEEETPVLRLTDGVTGTTTPTPIRRDNDNALDGGGGDKSIMNMTDLYEKWEECKKALRHEINVRKHSQYELQQIKQEVAQMTPEITRQREEYEVAITHLQEYQKRLSSIIQERDHAIADKNEMVHDLHRTEQQLVQQKQQVRDLAKQVQALLVSRSGNSNTENDGHIPTSVVEMQNQNQRLLGEHRRLSEQVEELQHQLQNDANTIALERTTKEMKTLRQQQKEQESLIEKIVQQRDLYRALQSNLDSTPFSDDTNNATQVSAMNMVQQQSERMKVYEQENLQLNATMKQIQSELDRTSREKEHDAEKIKRYDSVQNEMTKKLNELQNELLTSKGMIARNEADAKYHTEKCVRLEESLNRTQNEVRLINDTKSELQKINVELQSIISASNNEQHKLIGEKRTLEGKVRLYESQLQTLKNDYHRLQSDNEQLRHEISNQGTLIESIRRIETSLSVKSDNEVSTLQKEIETLTQKLVITEKNYSTQLENATIRMTELEGTIQDYQNKDHVTIQVKNDLLIAKSELQELKVSYNTMEKQLRSAKRKLGESSDGIMEDNDVETKLQLRIDTLEMELSATKSEMVALQEQVGNYQTMAKTNEVELIEIRTATDIYKGKSEKEIHDLKEIVAVSQKENTARQEMIRDLTNDLAGQRGEREKNVQELQEQISTLRSTIESNEQDVIAAKATTSALLQDIATLRAECTDAQNNYERELTQHAQARTSLRLSYETVEEATRAKATAEQHVETIQRELEQQLLRWDQEKLKMQEVSKILEQSVQETRNQNKVLHFQLETLNGMIEKNQLSRISAAEGMENDEGTAATADMETQKLVSELREIVRFMRSENELLQMQLDTATRTTDREKAALVVARRSLEEVRTELNNSKERDVAESNTETNTSETVRINEEQLVLLRDSNNLLRAELQQLKSNHKETLEEIESLKKATQPIEAVQREMDMKVTCLTAEKDSLERELDSWKKRMTSLVSNFNHIDPEEHRLLQKKLEEMRQDSESHNAWKKTTEEENTRIRSIAQNLNKQRKELLQKMESQRTEIEQLSNEKTALSTASGAGSQAQTELHEVKQRISKMENDAKSAKTELDGANSRNDRLREKLREFQNMIRDLRLKEKTLTEQLKEMKDAAAANVAAAVVMITDVVPTKAVDPTPPALSVEKEDKSLVPETISTPAKYVPSPEESNITIPKAPIFTFGPSKSTTTSLRPDATPFVHTAAVTASISKPSTPPPSTMASKPSLPPPSTKRTIDSISKPITEKKIPEPAKESNQNIVSGEKKELAIKEKLLERKRQLAEALKAQKRKQLDEAKKEQTMADTVGDKHAAKKPKTEDKPIPSRSPLPSSMTETDRNTPSVSTGIPSIEVATRTVVDSVIAVAEVAPTPTTESTTVVDEVVQIEKGGETKQKESTTIPTTSDVIVIDDSDTLPREMEAVEVEVNDIEYTDGVGVSMEDENTYENEDDNFEVEVEDDVVAIMDESTGPGTKMNDGTIGSSSLPFGSPFGSTTVAPSTFAFGGPSGPIFGQSSTIMSSSPFGSVPMESSATGTPFGTFGVIGSSNTLLSTSINATPPSFGSIPSNTTSSVPFGSPTFLDIKPPSSSGTELPKFTFGNSGSNITLPTPTIPASSNTGSMMMSQQPFGVFPSAPFGGGGTTAAAASSNNNNNTFGISSGGGFALSSSSTTMLPLFGTPSTTTGTTMAMLSTTTTIPVSGLDTTTEVVVVMDDDDDNDEGAMDAQQE